MYDRPESWPSKVVSLELAWVNNKAESLELACNSKVDSPVPANPAQCKAQPVLACNNKWAKTQWQIQ
jgi:hypothetical protein